nr:hypothetical protein [Tanacetum cinerariifolium]
MLISLEDPDLSFQQTTPPPPSVYRTTARMSIQAQTPIPFPFEAEADRLLAIPTPPPSPLTPLSLPLPQIPSPPFHVPSPPTTSLTYCEGGGDSVVAAAAALVDGGVGVGWCSDGNDDGIGGGFGCGRSRPEVAGAAPKKRERGG